MGICPAGWVDGGIYCAPPKLNMCPAPGY